MGGREGGRELEEGQGVPDTGVGGCRYLFTDALLAMRSKRYECGTNGGSESEGMQLPKASCRTEPGPAVSSCCNFCPSTCLQQPSLKLHSHREAPSQSVSRSRSLRR